MLARYASTGIFIDIQTQCNNREALMNHQNLTQVLMILSAFLLPAMLSGCQESQPPIQSLEQATERSKEHLTDPSEIQSKAGTPVPLSANPSSATKPKYPTEALIKNKHWQLIWQDEFDQNDIDLTKWQFEQNCQGGGNNEQQCYTNNKRNAFIKNGILNIVALKESYRGAAQNQDAPTYNINNTRSLPYTSARLRSKGRGDWLYGRIEVKAKLPQGQGTWPAIWMLPSDWVYGSWAASGEIDIMEAVNLGTPSDAPWAKPGEPEYRIKGTLHYGSQWPANKYSGQDFMQQGVNPADDFHVYAIEWQEGEIRWYVDDIHYATHTSNGWYSQGTDDAGNIVVADDNAPFNQKFHLLLNLAIGGEWPVNTNNKGIDANLEKASLLVDYVRVYQCGFDSKTGKGCASIGEDALYVEGFKAQ